MPGQSAEPHGSNLRKGRFSEPGRIYLVTTVTQDRTPTFSVFWLGRAVIHTMRYLNDQGAVHSLAFVIMPDHLHWLISLANGTTLPTVMRSLKGYSAKRISRLRATPAKRVWQPGYHDHALRNDEDVLATARYIVANPLRAGLVKNIGDYPLWDAKWL